MSPGSQAARIPSGVKSGCPSSASRLGPRYISATSVSDARSKSAMSDLSASPSPQNPMVFAGGFTHNWDRGGHGGGHHIGMGLMGLHLLDNGHLESPIVCAFWIRQTYSTVVLRNKTYDVQKPESEPVAGKFVLHRLSLCGLNIGI